VATNPSELSEITTDQMQARVLLKLSNMPMCDYLAGQQKGIKYLNGMDSNLSIRSSTFAWRIWSVCRLLHRIDFSVQDAVSSGWHFSLPFLQELFE